MYGRTPLEYDLTDEQARMRAAAREFAAEHLAPGAAERDRAEEFPYELFRKFGELGWVGYTFPEKYGGSDGSFLAYTTMVEEISRVDASAALVMSLNAALVISPIMIGGDEEQKMRFLPPLVRGEKLGCFCLTEPNAGSDASNLQTIAVPDGDEFVLNGEKIFIQHGNAAELAVVACRIPPRPDARPRISVLVVDDLKNTPGVEQVKLANKMGIRNATTGRIFFRDVRVPKENLLGKVGVGFRIVLQTLEGGRIGIAAQALGIAQGALDRALEWACTRVQFSQPIIKLGPIQSMIAKAATEVEAARGMIYRAALARERGEETGVLAAMAKLYASRVANRVAYTAVQVHGDQCQRHAQVVESALAQVPPQVFAHLLAFEESATR